MIIKPHGAIVIHSESDHAIESSATHADAPSNLRRRLGQKACLPDPELDPAAAESPAERGDGGCTAIGPPNTADRQPCGHRYAATHSRQPPLPPILSTGGRKATFAYPQPGRARGQHWRGGGGSLDLGSVRPSGRVALACMHAMGFANSMRAGVLFHHGQFL